MEKYRKFADQFTGINPFIPIYVNKKTNIFLHLIHLVHIFYAIITLRFYIKS